MVDFLYPIENEYRRTLDLSGFWYVATGDEETDGWKTRLPKEKQIAVPISMALSSTQDNGYETIWYEKRFYLRKEWLGDDVFLRFSGVSHKATIYVNGLLVGVIEYGFLTKVFDVTRNLRYGEQNIIVVKLSKNPEIKLSEQKGTWPNHHECNDSLVGVCESVTLFSAPATRILDVAIDISTATEERAEINYVSQVQGNCLITATLRETDGRIVATAVGSNATLTIEKPHLWKSGAGYLYQLDFEVSRLGKQVDAYTLPVGIRKVEIRQNHLYLNGEELYIKGVVWDSLETYGATLSELQQSIDTILWMGGNCIRGRNYPYSETLLNLADQLGILVIQELYSANVDDTFGEYASSFGKSLSRQSRLDNHRELGATIVQRDKNHPSVFAWNVIENPSSCTEESIAYLKHIKDSLRKYDSQVRPITFTMGSHIEGEASILELSDIIMLNRFDIAHIDTLEHVLCEEITYWQRLYPDKPIIFSSYGKEGNSAYSLVAYNGDLTWQETYMQINHRVFDMMPSVQGEILWNFSDGSYYYGARRHSTGIVDFLKRPGPLAKQMKNRWSHGQRKSDLGRFE